MGEPENPQEDIKSPTKERSPEVDKFLKGLPTDRFLPHEELLRSRLIEWVEAEKSEDPDGELLLDRALENSLMKKHADFLTRRGIALEIWVAQRIGAELKLDLADGGYAVSLQDGVTSV